MSTTQAQENLAQTLKRVLPEARVLSNTALATIRSDDGISQIAVPAGFDLRQVDHETLLPNPRRTKAKVTLSDPTSFLAYVERHAEPRTVVWCTFNPQNFQLSFTCVIDEHARGAAGWRSHAAHFTPDMSAEWKAWIALNKETQGQLAFAEFIERRELDIATQEGYPTSLQMLTMATEFEANSEKAFKSVARLQGGGVRLQYVNDDDARTIEEMKIFEKFQIGIPIFWAGPAYRIDARLKYRHGSGKVSFWYELIRADRVHEAAAKELIEQIRGGIGEVPLLMGTCA